MGERDGQGGPEQAASKASWASEVMNSQRDTCAALALRSPCERGGAQSSIYAQLGQAQGGEDMDEARLMADGVD